MEASQSAATAATGAANDADEDNPQEVVCFYNRAGQKVPKNVTILIVGPDVACIDENAFDCYQSLKEVDMSKATSLQIIALHAFANCGALVRVKWPPNLKTLGVCAFWRCRSLEEADMSNLHALYIIGEGAFAMCSAVVRVNWPPNLITLGECAFSECSSLEEADMSNLNALKTIGERAFSHCSALARVNCGPNLEGIGPAAFADCTSLTDIHLPSGFSKDQIGLNAFYMCQQLGDNTDADYWWIDGTDGSEEVIPDDDYDITKVMISLKCHWFVRKLRDYIDETELLSVDMQGHDLKKAIRIKNLYPEATPRLAMSRLVSMYAKSPLTAARLEDAAAQSDEISKADWAEARVGYLQRLEGIQIVYADLIFNLLHWYAGNGLAENLFVNGKKRKRDMTM